MTIIARSPAVLALAAVCLLGLGLRLVRLEMPLWGDETMSWMFAARSTLGETLRVAGGDPSPPLYYALLHVAIPVLGDGSFGLRLPSVILGALAIPLVYLTMREGQFVRADALAAALLTATSAMLIYYAQEARSAALATFLATLAIFLTARLIERGGRLAAGLPLAGVAVLMLLTHRYLIALVAALVLALAFFRRWRALAMPVLALVGGGLVFAVQAAAGSFVPGASGRPTDAAALWSLGASLAAGTIGMQRLDVIPHPAQLAFPHPLINVLLPLIGGVALLVVFGAGIAGRARFTAAQRRLLLLLALCASVPTAGALLAGTPLLSVPQWLLRGIIFIWPPFLMLIAAACSVTRLRIVLITAVVIVNGLALVPYYTTYTRYDEAIGLERLAATVTPDDLIIADPWYMHTFVRYYARPKAPIIGWDDGAGWVDVERAYQTDLSGRRIPGEPPNAPRGRIFVYPRREGPIPWADHFPDTLIYVHEKASDRWVGVER
jgi:hypothetical protein